MFEERFSADLRGSRGGTGEGGGAEAPPNTWAGCGGDRRDLRLAQKRANRKFPI